MEGLPIPTAPALEKAPGSHPNGQRDVFNHSEHFIKATVKEYSVHVE
jgi:hypothetical protein